MCVVCVSVFQVPKWGRATCRPEGLDHNAGPSAVPTVPVKTGYSTGIYETFFYKSRNIPYCCCIYICGV